MLFEKCNETSFNFMRRDDNLLSYDFISLFRKENNVITKKKSSKIEMILISLKKSSHRYIVNIIVNNIIVRANKKHFSVKLIFSRI